MAMLKIIQWNVISIFSRYGELCHLLDKEDVNLACISETRLEKNSKLKFQNFNFVHKARNKQGGGVGILIKKSLHFQWQNFQHIDDLGFVNNVDIVIVKITLTNKSNLHVVSLYSPPRNSANYTDPNFWEDLLLFCTTLGKVIICGDFNGHGPLWSNGESPYNVEGVKIESAINTADLVCLNDGTHTWASTDLSMRSVIDLTLVSTDLSLECNWHTLEHRYSSDHFPVVINVNNSKAAKMPCRPSFSLSKVDWKEFETFLNEKLNKKDILNNTAPIAYNNFIEHISNGINYAGGTRKDTMNYCKKPPAVWWDNRCTDLINEKRDLYKLFERFPNVTS